MDDADTGVLIVIARYNRLCFATLNAELLALTIYCLFILCEDIFSGREFSPQYLYYAIGFIVTLPFVIWHLSKLNYIVFISRRPLVWFDGCDLFYFKDSVFRSNIEKVTVGVFGRVFPRITLSAEGQRTVTLPYFLSESRQQILRAIENLKTQQPV